MCKRQVTRQQAAAAASDRPRYSLYLYVSGATPRSEQAIAAVTAIAEKYLHGGGELRVIDAYQQPELIHAEQIAVLPTLVRHSPPPMRRIVGDLSDEKQLLIMLELMPGGAGMTAPGDGMPDAGA